MAWPTNRSHWTNEEHWASSHDPLLHTLIQERLRVLHSPDSSESYNKQYLSKQLKFNLSKGNIS